MCSPLIYQDWSQMKRISIHTKLWTVEIYLYFGDCFDFYIQQNVLYYKILEIVNLTKKCIFQAARLHHDNSNMSK